MNALEAAAQLAAANPSSTVTAVTVGRPPSTTKLKKNVLARGVDDLVMVADDALAALIPPARPVAAIVGEGLRSHPVRRRLCR
ncbi:MAG: hypothetical protein ACLUVF_05265 [Adlercreutzia sp.]